MPEIDAIMGYVVAGSLCLASLSVAVMTAVIAVKEVRGKW